MAVITVKCPKCANVCTFSEGALFGFCNKCGSKLENGPEGVRVYDKTLEEDEELIFAWDRFDTCSEMTVPTRETHDIESLNFEIERMMDEFMTFAEVMKDIYSELDSMDDARKHRVCFLCFDMTDRLYMQFEQFLKEYSDFGMHDELKKIRDAFSSKLQKLSAEFASKQRSERNAYWADKQEEYERLKKALADAKDERAKVPFMDFERKWALDAEIKKLEDEINSAR